MAMVPSLQDLAFAKLRRSDLPNIHPTILQNQTQWFDSWFSQRLSTAKVALPNNLLPKLKQATWAALTDPRRHSQRVGVCENPYQRKKLHVAAEWLGLESRTVRSNCSVHVARLGRDRSHREAMVFEMGVDFEPFTGTSSSTKNLHRMNHYRNTRSGRVRSFE